MLLPKAGSATLDLFARLGWLFVLVLIVYFVILYLRASLFF
jgi:hypothetical protein